MIHVNLRSCCPVCGAKPVFIDKGRLFGFNCPDQRCPIYDEQPPLFSNYSDALDYWIEIYSFNMRHVSNTRSLFSRFLGLLGINGGKK